MYRLVDRIVRWRYIAKHFVGLLRGTALVSVSSVQHHTAVQTPCKERTCVILLLFWLPQFSVKEFTMILGLSTSTFTLIHVLLSLVGIASGFVVLYGLITARRYDRWTLLFLSTTVAT